MSQPADANRPAAPESGRVPGRRTGRPGAPNAIDADFLALPRTLLADAALQRARELGCTHADFRLVKLRTAVLSIRDRTVEDDSDDQALGLSVRVVHGGSWGFASAVSCTPQAARDATERAVTVARVSAPLTARPVELADEPVYRDVEWTSAYDLDPFAVPRADRVARFTELTDQLLGAEGVDHADVRYTEVRETTFYADLAGSSITQQRIRVEPDVTATRIDRHSGRFDTMRTLLPPAGRGWEYPAGRELDDEVAELPALLAELAAAPRVTPGKLDLVIHPSNLWLTIHESIGHATELDRALGYEAAYAGTSFATVDKLGTLKYGSPLMNVTGDRTVEHGLATTGYDDEGVAAQSFDIIREGILVGYQLNRQMARDQSLGRSNGCAYADEAGHVPLQRMANVSLAADPGGPDVAGLIAGVENGLYVMGDKSWSIDMQRYNFQFTGQRFYRIVDGQLAGQVRDAAYQATTTEFWGSMDAVGNPSTYQLGGALNCGKGQPGQVAPVSHGCPAARFRGVNVLDTAAEGA